MALCAANASNTAPELLNGISKQRRLFNRLNSDLGNLEAATQDENPYASDSDSKSNSELRLWEQLLKTRQRYKIIYDLKMFLHSFANKIFKFNRTSNSNSDYDQLNDGLPFNTETDEMLELENLFDVSSGRATRSKNRHKVCMIYLFIKVSVNYAIIHPSFVWLEMLFIGI